MSYTEDLLLPSRGIIYRLSNFDGVVKVKAFTTRAYKDLLAANASEVGLRQFIDSCLVDCPVKARDMNQEDILAILFKVRVMTLGNTLKSQIKCPNCGHTDNIEHDLNDVSIKYLYTEKYPIPVTLPCGQEIKVRFPTGADARKAKGEAERRADIFKNSASDYLPVYNIVSLIDLNGQDIIEKAEWYENLNPRDAIYIDSVFSEMGNVFGVNLSQTTKCSVCDKSYTSYISIGSDFFRPDGNVTISATGKAGNLAGVIEKPAVPEQES